jgi:hypothetical protein
MIWVSSTKPLTNVAREKERLRIERAGSSILRSITLSFAHPMVPSGPFSIDHKVRFVASTTAAKLSPPSSVVMRHPAQLIGFLNTDKESAPSWYFTIPPMLK